MYHREAKSFPCAISTYGIPVIEVGLCEEPGRGLVPAWWWGWKKRRDEKPITNGRREME